MPGYLSNTVPRVGIEVITLRFSRLHQPFGPGDSRQEKRGSKLDLSDVVKLSRSSSNHMPSSTLRRGTRNQTLIVSSKNKSHGGIRGVGAGVVEFVQVKDPCGRRSLRLSRLPRSPNYSRRNFCCLSCPCPKLPLSLPIGGLVSPRPMSILSGVGITFQETKLVTDPYT